MTIPLNIVTEVTSIAVRYPTGHPAKGPRVEHLAGAYSHLRVESVLARITQFWKKRVRVLFELWRSAGGGQGNIGA